MSVSHRSHALFSKARAWAKGQSTVCLRSFDQSSALAHPRYELSKPHADLGLRTGACSSLKGIAHR